MILFHDPPLCLAESFTADHKPLMGEAPEVRGFFLGCGFNSAGKRDLKGSHLGHPNADTIPWAELGTHSHVWPAGLICVLTSSPRDDAGRRLREGAGSLDHPRAAGEGHVRLRHQVSHPGCPRTPWAVGSFAVPPGPWVVLGDRFRGRAGCWYREWVSGSVCAAARVPPRSWNQLHSMALMHLHVGFISFASSRFYANGFHQT